MDNPVATLSRNQYRKVLMRWFLKEGLLEFTVCSRRPMTVVFAKFQDENGGVYENFGWSKVAHPDQWDEQEGLKRAVLRAAANAAKDYVNKFMASKDQIIVDKYGKRKISFTQCTKWKLGDMLPFDDLDF